MKKYLVILLGVMLTIGTSQVVFAKKYDKAKTEVDSVKAPANSDIQDTIKTYITAVSEASGTLNINDPHTKKVLNLSLVKVHKKVQKTKNNYYACVDFKDVKTGEKYDLDFDVAENDGTLSVVELRIHKAGGEARYDYDDDNNRVALKDESKKSYLGGLGMPRMRTKK